MRAPRQESISLPAPADAVFQAALGVVQNTKSSHILAVHTPGRLLVVREKSKLSNPKFLQVSVQEQGSGSQLQIVVGTDPRTPKALLDGKANERFLNKFVDSVRRALDGSAPAPATPVPDHFVQGKTQVPWTDPTQDPQIELDGNFLALYGL